MANLDIDGDGKVSEEDIHMRKEIIEIEMREKKADIQANMARIAMTAMILFTVALFTPIVSVERVAALSELLGMFYIAQASVVGAYMGFTAWLSKK